jgi:hypothetical protein
LVQDRLHAPAPELLEGSDIIAPQLGQFLRLQDFEKVWPKLQENAPDPPRLASQFHRWFDGFKSLKLIHYLRDNGFALMPIEEAIAVLLESFGDEGKCANDPERLPDLLDHLRAACRDWPAAGSQWKRLVI